MPTSQAAQIVDQLQYRRPRERDLRPRQPDAWRRERCCSVSTTRRFASPCEEAQAHLRQRALAGRGAAGDLPAAASPNARRRARRSPISSANTSGRTRCSPSGISSQVQVTQLRHALDSCARGAQARRAQQLAAAARGAGRRSQRRARSASRRCCRRRRHSIARSLNLSYTVVSAPQDGDRRQSRAAAGRQLHQCLEPVVRSHLHARCLGRGQLQGKPAHLHAAGPGGDGQDRQLSGKLLHARITSLSPGTGSAFSMLPPENATGNWVKVVQRLPVRLARRPMRPRRWPLRAGLSADVTVDTRPSRAALVRLPLGGRPQRPPR